MITTQPFFIDDRAALRGKLQRAEARGDRLGQVWATVRRRARSRPEAFPWFTPFVALITQDPRDLESARAAIRRYVATFEPQTFGMGLQFHFWCFAFPHARWSLYFQWLWALGAWSDEEARDLSGQLILFQFVNFFYGLRTKPEPDCVDNQTMSLCFSNALLGQLFSAPPFASHTAARMRTDGLRRLPGMLGGMPPSGYSGEGSQYMDGVVGPCVPYLVELLERALGGNWFDRPLEPHGGSARAILEMIAREWMPGGLLLPWDHYGYMRPSHAAIAYAARRTGDPQYLDLLENHADWSFELGTGWGYDDTVWSLIWWPERRSAPAPRSFVSWCQAQLGAALVAPDASRYLMQMWDPSEPGFPGRAHVNPNSLVLNAFGVPLTIDGVTGKSCTAFDYADTWLERHNMGFQPVRANFGSGCAGAHSVLLVDGWEGMRAQDAYPQASLVEFAPAAASVTADVTPLYRARWPDTIAVRRRSRLVADQFWLIEDLACFQQDHDLVARWWLRPAAVASPQGVAIETAEGIRLDLLPLLGPDDHTTTPLADYPDRLDGRSLRVDFHQRARVGRWLWLAVPRPTRTVAADLADDWQLAPDPTQTWDLPQARQAIADSPLHLPLTQPAFMLADLPVTPRWWYRRTLRLDAPAPRWLRLPSRLLNPALWVNGQPLDLQPHLLRLDLLPIDVPLPPNLRGDVEIVLRTNCGVSQYGKDSPGGSGFWGRPALLAALPPLAALHASFAAGQVSVQIGPNHWQIPHLLLTPPSTNLVVPA